MYFLTIIYNFRWSIYVHGSLGWHPIKQDSKIKLHRHWLVLLISMVENIFVCLISFWSWPRFFNHFKTKFCFSLYFLPFLIFTIFLCWASHIPFSHLPLSFNHLMFNASIFTNLSFPFKTFVSQLKVSDAKSVSPLSRLPLLWRMCLLGLQALQSRREDCGSFSSPPSNCCLD